MSYWFTADCHFDHQRILSLCNRPFSDIGEMNRAIIDNYNKLVKTKDYLYILGDFCWGQVEDIKRFRNLIKCDNIIFIWGNHDKVLRRNVALQKILFLSTHDILNVTINNQMISMCHYPFLEWDKFFYGAWNLFGHVHGNLSPLPGTLACDVGVDCHEYKPVSFEQLQVIMNNRRSFNAATLNDGLRPHEKGEEYETHD